MGHLVSFRKIIDDDNKLREWIEWSDSFENILKHWRLIAYSNKETDIDTIFNFIGILYKLEANINKIVIEVQYLIDAKRKKCLNELNMPREATFPDEELGISIWEVIVDIKEIPSRDSD